MGEFLIRSTAILAAACYAGRVAIDISGRTDDRWQRRARWLWTLGGGMLWLHVIAAFQFQHGWSHAAAWEHTRQRTLALTGWNSGAGLYLNEAMTAIWLADVLAWWFRLDWPRRQRIWYGLVQTFFAFLLINATTVFGPWYWGPIAMAYVTFLLIIGYVNRVKRVEG